ncbi:hypothetical protein BGX29_003910 [Mortierella sp. GBA35]|nr:hypothetical protein BGX29_003910 [Mortierella sp. GBA35]
MHWFRKAADQGLEDAQYRIGILYKNGQGVSQDYTQAMNWLKKATDQGRTDAHIQYELLRLTSFGPLDNASVSPSRPSDSSVLRNSRNTLTTPDPAEVFHVDIYTDPDTKKQFVLWDDIRLAFDDALHVRHLSRVVPFVKGEDLVPLKPHRIAAFPDIVLDVVVSGQSAQAEVAQPPPSRLEQIEQQAARIPRYDPLTALRHRPSTLTQKHLNRPSITLVTRSHVAESTFQIRNKDQALQIVKKIMKKIAAHVDLEALHAKGDVYHKTFQGLWNVT